MQRAPELFLQIKAAVDRNRAPGQFLLTGSAQVLALPRLADSLAGRMEIVELSPFSQGEIKRKRERFVDQIMEDPRSMRWRQPSWREGLHKVTLHNMLLFLAVGLIGGGDAIADRWTVPDPVSAHVASGVDQGLSWRLFAIEYERATCLTLSGTDDAGSTQICGRPWQPRASMTAARMALRDPNRPGELIHFIVGTAPPEVATIRVLGAGHPRLEVTRYMLMRPAAFPFGFFVWDLASDTGALRVRAFGDDRKLLGEVEVPARPQAVAGRR